MKTTRISKYLMVAMMAAALAACGGGGGADVDKPVVTAAPATPVAVVPAAAPAAAPASDVVAPAKAALSIFISQPFTAYAAGQTYQVRGEGSSYDYVRTDAAKKVLVLSPYAQTIQLDDGRNPLYTCYVSGGVVTC